ncbi:MAG: tRNA (guanosine(37)-N1)-methyltransferase TrmD [Candidatus Portnoybacteria bacterium]|nr:tRNA (guanosine(37)-N1)-methyltransferase TrmD [Candidatus Portnoybacteria bacterium]
MCFDIITIFPQIFASYFNESILRRAQKKRLIKIKAYDLRKWTSDKHRTVDDRPYGGGPGMILKIEPIYRAVEEICKKNKPFFCHSGLDPESRILDSRFRGNDRKEKEKRKIRRRVILFSAKGKTMTQADVRRLAKYDQLILICGRYEGVDERVAKYVADEELSVGDYVLTGGEIPAMIVVDAVSRLVPGVLGKKESLEEESFGKCLRTTDYGLQLKLNSKAVVGSRLAVDNSYLEYPQYTRPEEFNGWRVPRVLLGGDHKKIEEWRKKMSNF